MQFPCGCKEQVSKTPESSAASETCSFAQQGASREGLTVWGRAQGWERPRKGEHFPEQHLGKLLRSAPPAAARAQDVHLTCPCVCVCRHHHGATATGLPNLSAGPLSEQKPVETEPSLVFLTQVSYFCCCDCV